MASDEIDMDLVLGAGGVVDSYTNSDAVGELLPNINADDPALLGLDIDVSATATATEKIPDWDTMEYLNSEGAAPIGNSHDGTVRAGGRTQSTTGTGGVLGHLNADIFDAESAVELSDLKSGDRDGRSEVDGVKRAANTPSEDADAEDPLDGKGECDPVCDNSRIQHIGGNEKHSSKVGELSNLDSAQCVSVVKDKGDSADRLTSNTGGGGGVQELMIQGSHGLTGEIHGEAYCGASSTELLSINKRTPSKIMSVVSKQRILAHQITRSNEPRNSIQPDHQRVPKLPSPGPGWTAKFVPGVDQNRWHWISPTKKLEFTRRSPARLFEELRKKYGADEVVALEKYKLQMKKKKPPVITQRSSTAKYISLSANSKERRACGHVTIKRPCRSSIRAPTLIKPNRESNQAAVSPRRMRNRPPPGHGWRSKYDKKSHTHHWLSPTRSIEFMRYPVACEFETLRSKYGSDEVRAWDEYRKMKVGKKKYVVNPSDYDLPASESAVKSVDTSKPARRRGTAHSTKSKASDHNDRDNGNKQRDSGRVNPKQQRRDPKGAAALTTKRIFAAGPNRETVRADAPQNPRTDSPGPGWKSRHVEETKGNFAYYWLSPTRCIEFRRYKQACEFEQLRSTYGSDEVRAWKEYRKMKLGGDVRVVTPSRYDENTSNKRTASKRHDQGLVKVRSQRQVPSGAAVLTTRRNITSESSLETKQALIAPRQPRADPPGPGWKPKYVQMSKNRFLYHWVSPTRSIEFKRRKQACKFEGLRSEYGSDEVRAWKEYRKSTVGDRTSRVVNPCLYDGGVSNKRRADDKHDQGHVTPKRQRRVPSANGAVALTTRSSASELCQETVLACSTPRKAGVDSPGPCWKSKYTQSDDVDVDSCYVCDDGGATSPVTLDRASIIASLRPNTNIEGLSDYELLRLQKIQRNEAKLASLGLCGITSKNHNNNSGSNCFGGNGTNEGSEGASSNAIAESKAFLPFHSPPPVPRYPSKPRQFLHPNTQTDDRIGPGWTVVHDDSFCRTWISPTQKIRFSNIREAFQFEELRKNFGNNEDMAWKEYQHLKPDRVADRAVVASYSEKSDDDNAILPSSSSFSFTSSRSQLTSAASQNVYRTRLRNHVQDVTATNENMECGESIHHDTCFVCGDGGDLVLCDNCPKSFHMHCNVPRLHGIPRGKWKCCECMAPEYTRRQRCGECVDCLRPHCGECVSCKSLIQFGGDGNYGGACKFRKCKFMRFAAPEIMPADVGLSPMGTVTLPRTKVTKRAAGRACNAHPIPGPTPRADPPGPGWHFKRVEEKNRYSYHWISPTRNIEFQRHKQALEFEKLRSKYGTDELRAWEEYRKMTFCKRTWVVAPYDYDLPALGNDTRVVNPRHYDGGASNKRRADDKHDRGHVNPKRQRHDPKGAAALTTRRSSASEPCQETVKAFSGPRTDPPRPGQMSEYAQSDDVDVDSCYICDDGGDLILCDYCSKAFHLECHIPRLFQIPHGKWQCCECRAAAYKKRRRCGECEACLKPDCGVCSACKGKKKFGGDGKHGKSCKDRDCKNMRFAPPERMSNNGTCPFNSRKKNVKMIGNSRSAFKSVAESSSNRMSNNSLNLLDCPFSTSFEPTPDNGLNSREINIQRIKPSNKKCFFSEMFRGKTLRITSHLNDSNPEKTVTFDGMKYTLASAKLVKGNGGRMSYMKSKEIELLYVRSTCLRKELENICNFPLLKTTKVVARLGHFQSNARSIQYFEPINNIMVIPDVGHEGCGFCPDYFFDKWGIKGCDAIQVRIACPIIGLAKGMLLKKSGISHILIPDTMIKVKHSKTCEKNYAAVIIKNEFPSYENKQFGRFLDPHAADPCKSWAEKGRKPLSDMYQRMLVGFGVNRADVNEYTRTAKNHEKLKHAHLKGVIDPTGKLPKNQVFISGYTTNVNKERVLFGKAHSKVFLSRSPCLEPTDAKLLNVVGSKPREMSTDDWNMLCSYGYGTIIFPQSRSVPLANVIADGDLDGDDYFVLWDERIIHHLMNSKDKLTSKSRKLLNTLELPPDRETHSVKKGDNNSASRDNYWLSKAQDVMLDFPTQLEASQLVSKFYGLCTKASIREDGSINLYDEDAIAYARAYKNAMDVQKHGGEITLPQHLHANLEDKYRQLLTSS